MADSFHSARLIAPTGSPKTQRFIGGAKSKYNVQIVRYCIDPPVAYDVSLIRWVKHERKRSSRKIINEAITIHKMTHLMAALAAYAIEPLKMSAIKLLGVDNFFLPIQLSHISHCEERSDEAIQAF